MPLLSSAQRTLIFETRVHQRPMECSDAQNESSFPSSSSLRSHGVRHTIGLPRGNRAGSARLPWNVLTGCDLCFGSGARQPLGNRIHRRLSSWPARAGTRRRVASSINPCLSLFVRSWHINGTLGSACEFATDPCARLHGFVEGSCMMTAALLALAGNSGKSRLLSGSQSLRAAMGPRRSIELPNQ